MLLMQIAVGIVVIAFFFVMLGITFSLISDYFKKRDSDRAKKFESISDRIMICCMGCVCVAVVCMLVGLFMNLGNLGTTRTIYIWQ